MTRGVFFTDGFFTGAFTGGFFTGSFTSGEPDGDTGVSMDEKAE